MYFVLYYSANLHLVNEQACAGDDLTFSCNSSGTRLLVWNVSAFAGFPGMQDAFGQTLNNNIQRITSPDLSFGPNPTSITIFNAAATDNGAMVQCGVVNGVSS